MNKNVRSNIDPLFPSLSIESLEEIVRNCQRNEQRLHELERHARHERKNAERLLREVYQTKQERDKQMNDNNNNKNPIQDKPSLEKIDNKIHRVRFNIPENEHDIETEQKKSTTKDDELTDLSRRCENLLSRLHIHRNRSTIFENSDDYPQRISSNSQNDQPVTLQQALEFLRPEFISNSRQRVQRINFLREEREHQQILPSSHSNSIRFPSTYQEIKQKSKKKYEQLPEVKDRLREDLTSEIRRRNYLRAKIFQTRLQQHVLLHGRTNIDESLIMIDP